MSYGYPSDHKEVFYVGLVLQTKDPLGPDWLVRIAAHSITTPPISSLRFKTDTPDMLNSYDGNRDSWSWHHAIVFIKYVRKRKRLQVSAASGFFLLRKPRLSWSRRKIYYHTLKQNAAAATKRNKNKQFIIYLLYPGHDAKVSISQKSTLGQCG